MPRVSLLPSERGGGGLVMAMASLTSVGPLPPARSGEHPAGPLPHSVLGGVECLRGRTRPGCGPRFGAHLPCFSHLRLDQPWQSGPGSLPLVLLGESL